MDRGPVLLQGLIKGLRNWSHTIKKATYADTLDIEPHESGEFKVRISGVGKGNIRWVVEKEYTKQYCFGATFSTPHLWKLQKKNCQYMRELIYHVLVARGL